MGCNQCNGDATNGYTVEVQTGKGPLESPWTKPRQRVTKMYRLCRECYERGEARAMRETRFSFNPVSELDKTRKR